MALETMRYDLFVAHSHDDQGDVYALTRWLWLVWGDLRLFLTSADQTEIFRLVPDYYLEALRASRVFVLWATPPSIRSPYVLEEVRHAATQRCQILVAHDQRLEEADVAPVMRRETCGAATAWSSFDVALEAQQRALIAAIAAVVARPVPTELPSLPIRSGRVMGGVAPRPRPEVTDPRLPDMGAVTGGFASRDDTLIWLEMLEKWGDNLARAAGIKTYLIPAEDEGSEEERVRARTLDVLLAADRVQLPLVVRSLRPLIDLELLATLRHVEAGLPTPAQDGDGESWGDKAKAIRQCILAVGPSGAARPISPAECSALCAAGVKLAGEGRYQEALEAFERVVSLCPAHADAHQNRGAALMELARYEEALEALDVALSFHSRDPMAHRNRATVLLRLGRRREALSAAQTSIECDARNASAWNVRGAALLSLGRLEEALAAFTEALARDPNHPEARYNADATRRLLRMRSAEDA